MERQHEPKRAIVVVKKKDRGHTAKNETSHTKKHEFDPFKAPGDNGHSSGAGSDNQAKGVDEDQLQ